MTWDRLHVEFEGSHDAGETWRTYEFKWQPQALDGKLRFMAPHLPRFDWNLWFATLGKYRDYPLVTLAAMRLMDNRESVIDLFKQNPFPEKPPHLIRFPLYQYEFTDLMTFRETGAYWKRKKIRNYAPTLFKNPRTGKFQWVTGDE